MFRNYFLISYQRHKYFCPISVYILPNNDASFFKKQFQFVFETISDVASTGDKVFFYVIKTEAAMETRHQNESICIFFVKGEEAAGATEVRIT